MTVELLHILSIIAYIAAGALFLLVIALFFLLDIPKLYGDVSGRTAKKAIESIRQQNESIGNKSHKLDVINGKQEKTDNISSSGRLLLNTNKLSVSLNAKKPDKSAQNPKSNETTVLLESMNGSNKFTDNLQQDIQETTLLVNEENLDENHSQSGFTIDIDLSFLGSSEIIE